MPPSKYALKKSHPPPPMRIGHKIFAPPPPAINNERSLMTFFLRFYITAHGLFSRLKSCVYYDVSGHEQDDVPSMESTSRRRTQETRTTGKLNQMWYVRKVITLSISKNDVFPEVLHNYTWSAFLPWNQVYSMMFQVRSRMTYPQVNQHRKEEAKKQGGQVNSSKCDIFKITKIITLSISDNDIVFPEFFS